MKKDKINNENLEDVKSSKNKNLKIMFIIIAIIAVIAIVAQVAYALFYDSDVKDEKEVIIAKINVDLIENWPNKGTTTEIGGETETYDELGISLKSKEIYGKSTENMDAYVRVRLIPVVEYKKNNEWITVPVAQDSIALTVDTNDWVKDGDYWYYKEILAGNEETKKMNVSWEVENIPSTVAEYPVRTDVRVILEYAQTTNDMWKSLFNIDELPAGVEQVGSQSGSGN